jgi:hypothetical protein
MKKISLVLSLALVNTLVAFGQVPEDALKFSWNAPSGTARNQAIGGVMGSLGGDITATFVNPAGLGFYKTHEFVLSPAFVGLTNKSLYRGDNTKINKNFFNLGTTGVVAGFGNYGGKWTSSAISLAVTQTANFNGRISYEGKNNFSSLGEQYAAEIASSGVSLFDAPGSNKISFPSRLAAYTYLVDTLTPAGATGPEVVSMALHNNLKNGAGYLVNQKSEIETRGGITEFALGLAANMDDKVYIGGSIGLPLVNYEKTSTITERDATGNANNNFEFTELKETFTTKGLGFNAKIGIIVKPVEQLRLGLAIHTPSFYGLKDTYDATMTTNTEEYKPFAGRTNLPPGVDPNFQPKTQKVTVKEVNNNQIAEFKYDLITPWKFMVSGAYVLHEVADVSKQKGFISADVEYVAHRSPRYSPADETGDKNYYEGVNDGIKNYYKNAFNFRVGGELKFTTVMARLGFSYYGNPYKEKEFLKGNKMFISGGLGYRNKGMFIDLAYVYGLQKDVNFPYRLPDKANTFAVVKGNGGNIAATIGFKW